MDYFRKWPEAYALPDQEATTVADALVEGTFATFGAAEVIHSDQGRNFEAGVFSALYDCLGVQKTRTTALHPQSDGLVERSTQPWQNNSPSSLQNISVIGICTSLSSYWPTGRLCRIPPHAHLPCSCWGESCGCQQKWLLAGPQTHQRFHLDRNTPEGSRTGWSQLTPLPMTSCRKRA